MDITPLVSKDAQVIQAYRQGNFKISNAVYDGAVIVTPYAVQAWEYTSDDDFSGLANALAFLNDMPEPREVLLFGTGATFKFIPPAVKLDIKKRFGVTLDAMDTGAACRTYNVLLAEGRGIVAVLLPFLKI